MEAASATTVPAPVTAACAAVECASGAAELTLRRRRDAVPVVVGECRCREERGAAVVEPATSEDGDAGDAHSPVNEVGALVHSLDAHASAAVADENDARRCARPSVAAERRSNVASVMAMALASASGAPVWTERWEAIPKWRLVSALHALAD